MGEKGNIRNLYKEWILFLKKKKAKKKVEEIEEKRKQKKAMKVKAFFITLLAILMAPIGISAKSSKKSKKDLKVIISELSEIKKEIKDDLEVPKLEKIKDKLSIYNGTIKDIRANDRKASKKDVELAILEVSILSDRIDDMIVDKIQKVEPFLDEKEKAVSSSVEDVKVENKTSKISKSVKIESKVVPSDSKTKSKNNVVSGSTMITNNKKQRIIGRRKVGVGLNENIILFLTVSNLEIEDILKKLKEDLDLEKLSEISRRITELANRRINIRSRYDLFAIADLYDDKDKFKLLRCNDKIEELYDLCKKKLVDVEVKKEDKKESKKEVKVELDIKEINSLKKVISADIANQKEKVNSIRKALLSVDVKVRRTSLLGSIKNMVTKTLFLCLGLVPFAFFKNKLLGGLASAFLINNSIRSIRSVTLNRDIAYLELQHLGVIISSQKDCIKNTRIVYEDAIMQISSLKAELESRYSLEEIEEILGQLDNMEDDIRSKNRSLMDIENDLDYEYSKSKQKIKKMSA